MNIFFVSLGCDKNLVDSEKMLGSLKAHGHSITDDESDAQVIVVNTCCFIHDAKQESIETILELAELKKQNLKFLIVTGCLAQRYGEEITAAISEVDAVLGTSAYDRLPEVIDSLADKSLEKRTIIMDLMRDFSYDGQRLRSDINHYSYIKIAEGCDKHCTYCVIPSIKGSYRSYDFENIVHEAEELVADGVNELMVIAQETTLYGTDLYGRKRLPELLRRLCGIEGLEWLRLMYCYPEEIDDELIDTIAAEDKICKYIDIPIQHASDNILKRMGRRTNRAQIESIIERLREKVPGIVIRTSLISGFPGETEEDHEILKEFITSEKLDKVGVFTYSREENTPAWKMKPQVPARVKNARRRELMLLQQKIVFEKNDALKGSTMKVIIDGKLSDEDVYVGRTYMDAPGIDGSVFIKSERDIISGTVINAVIDGFKGYDLIAHEET